MSRVIISLKRTALLTLAGAFVTVAAVNLIGAEEKKWEVHDMNRPKPRVVTPGDVDSRSAPSDAIVLFDGKNFDEWTGKNDQVKWKIEGDAMVVTKKAGAIRTKRTFGDVQLHLEWAAPTTGYENKTGQDKGNSGVFLMGGYEVQVLDSYKSETYADGQAASLYGQYPPLVNACRPPGQWQTYDIIFRRPHFDESGNVTRPARVTVLHNGVLVQHNVAIKGRTAHKKEAKYKAHPDKLPLSLQDHGDPVRYRNIWIRELE